MILDTNAVSAILAGDRKIEPVLAVEPRHHLPAIVLGEYRYGLRGSRSSRRLEPQLDRLEQESVVLVVDDRTARVYAEVRHDLKTRGRPIPENDVWIAALALQHGLAVVSRDEHFLHVPGLSRVAW